MNSTPDNSRSLDTEMKMDKLINIIDHIAFWAPVVVFGAIVIGWTWFIVLAASGRAV